MRLTSLFVLLSCLCVPLAAAEAAAATPTPAPAATPAQAAAWLDKRDPRAAEAVEALVAAAPDDVDRRVLQVRLRIQQRRFEDAVELAEDAVEAAPRHAAATLWLGNAYGNRIGEVGLLSQARMASKIRSAYERALELDPDTHDARMGLVEFHLQAPAIVGGDVDVARRHAVELARRDPPRGHYARGRLAARDEKPAEALLAYAAAHAGRPDNPKFRIAAGIAYQEAGRWDDAFALFDAWAADEPAVSAPQYQIGRTAALSGKRLDDGAAALERYLGMPQAPGQPLPQHAWYRLGQIQALAGDKATARVSLKRSLELDPDLDEADEALRGL
jgi:tetratricopeptide (TPR) repeat protein